MRPFLAIVLGLIAICLLAYAALALWPRVAVEDDDVRDGYTALVLGFIILLIAIAVAP